MELTPNTHHLVRKAMLGATIMELSHEVRPGQPDRLILDLDNGQQVVLRGEPLDMHFAAPETR